MSGWTVFLLSWSMVNLVVLLLNHRERRELNTMGNEVTASQRTAIEIHKRSLEKMESSLENMVSAEEVYNEAIDLLREAGLGFEADKLEEKTKTKLVVLKGGKGAP